ncbi:MAG: cytochrome D1 domain-containing protein [Gammaproteobacteria bacterium]|nr:cytochrome D1 domain-containing protein [Gammaproteobacteria bacterium]
MHQTLLRHLLPLTLLCCLGAGAPAAADPAAAADLENRVASGQALYLRQCATCHQRDGRGIDGRYPSLHDLAGPDDAPRDTVRTLLAGRRNIIEGEGRHYASIMPAHGHLGNETIAAALTYVLTQWSSAAAPVSSEAVAAVRLELLSDHPGGLEAMPGPSPLAGLDTDAYVTSDGPPLTVVEFARAQRLYYGQCTGCHGVLREGVGGSPLTPELMRERGTEYLRSVISYGSTTGMPNWGTSETLSGQDISTLARFLQHPVPRPPDMDAFQIRDGWQQQRIPSERPDTPQHDYALDAMFVVTLHDVGEIALLDGIGKTLIARVPVGAAPHRVVASASGRYLYVLGRDGTVSLVDLFASPPEQVASVRIGYEARALAASAAERTEQGYVLAGAFWPPQLVLLDGRTLEPLRLLSTRGTDAQGDYHPEPRVSDITASPRIPGFISNVKETGQVLLLGFGADGELPSLEALQTVTELRAGSLSSDGRYYLTPADSNAVSVLDVEQQRIVAEIPARVFGGNAGTSFVHAQHGPVWATSTMVDNHVILIGTDPVAHADQAWQILERVPGPASGSLFLATHPQSPHLWMDTPLTASAEHSQAVAVFRKDDLQRGYRSLPVGRWSGLTAGPRRVIQPAYSADGSEVWMVVWNPQDLGGAVVVVDDASLEPVATVRLPDIITPTRIYSVAALRTAAQADAPD